MRKFFASHTRIPLLALLGATVVVVVEGEARAQSAGTASKPLPDVLLLIDTSGSMERMADGSLPIQNYGPPPPTTTNQCSPGVASNPNRWGMLLQALTGNFQPFYSCDAMDRGAGVVPGPGSRFVREYRIDGENPYDTDYFLPYHRPLTGSGANACAITPWALPGPAGVGVGPGNYNAGAGTNTYDFPDNAFATIKYTGGGGDLNGAIMGAGIGAPPTITATQCVFDQNPDGQLDNARDYVRFGLMTFDNDTDPREGVTGGPVIFNHDQSVANAGIGLQPPFLGQWSYIRSAGNFALSVATPPQTPLTGIAPTPFISPGAVGHPPGCAFQYFEVGARNEHAPPWEGRLVPFANDDANVADLGIINDRIQKTLLASRPYGATPIDAMFDDARDYYYQRLDWGGAAGTPSYVQTPQAASPPGNGDRYKCREKYIVLLTDGAPNLDLRPSCGASGVGNVCPYPWKAADIALEMAGGPPASGGGVTPRIQAPSATVTAVKTFVIGFSVNGSSTTIPNNGFPTAPLVTNCKDFYANAAYGAGNVQTMSTYCTTPPLRPVGSTAEACCKLTEIAAGGSYDTGTNLPTTGPFFAESQADIVLAFGKILATITKTATTKTVPAYSPTAVFSPTDYGVGRRSGEFVASFIPNALKPWSGEIYRFRRVCSNPGPALNNDTPPSPDPLTAGDLMSVNLAQQTSSSRRRFISVRGTPTGAFIDSARTIRPFATGAPTVPVGGDGLPTAAIAGYGGTEISQVVANPIVLPVSWDLAMDIDGTTCKAGRTVLQGGVTTRGTKPIPALTAAECTSVMWGFTTAVAGPQNLGAPAHDFNVRCSGGGGAAAATSGRCSITGTVCVVGGADCSTLGTGEVGEVCVPDCSALGAIYHSNPSIIGPPQGFLREEGYRAFALGTRQRPTMLFTATTDGVLHAFNALPPPGSPAIQPPGAEHELWAFVPPAVLPRVKSTYPSGNAILLDGTPVVKDVVWDRLATDSGVPGSWHTTLVAGLGSGGRGYYALNVTDGACTGVAGLCINAYGPPGATNLADVSASTSQTLPLATPEPRGPHFLWQLTDVQRSGSNQGKVVRTARDGTQMVGIFGKDTGTPAIGTLQIGAAGAQRHVGVAILPGGIENGPIIGANNVPQLCARNAGGAAVLDVSDPGYPKRPNVRQWAGPPGGTSCTSAPVPGRGVTIVRLDTGEVIRHFGRRFQDVPDSLQSVTTDTMFDSPMIGTPVVYPDAPGTPIQRIYIGDADGTVWRINVSDTSPALWRAELFQDLFAPNFPSAAPAQLAVRGQPIMVTPTLTTDDGGSVVLNVATGEQESFVAPLPAPAVGDDNFITSIRENSLNLAAQVRWFRRFQNNERVTGPMVVFDRTLYFASYLPTIPSGVTCGSQGQARIWGMHFMDPADAAGAPVAFPPTGANGGYGRLPGAVQFTNVLDNPVTPGFDESTAPVPGVQIRALPSCSDGSAGFGGGVQSMSSTTYELVYVPPGKTAPGTTTSVTAVPLAITQPRNQTRVDSWAFITQ